MSGVSTTRGHAIQLERVLGIVECLRADGDAPDVVEQGHAVLQRRAKRIIYQVEPQSFEGVDAPEWRTLAVFCDSAQRHLEPADARKLRALGEYAAEQLQEASR